MTRSATRRPRPEPRARTAPAFALHGTADCPPSEARAWTIVTAIVIAAFAAAVLVVIGRVHPVGDYFTESDFYGAYAKGARIVQQGQLLPSRYTVIGPGYEVALALAGFVVRDLFLAAELLSWASAVTLVALWCVLLARRVDARLAAAAAAVLCTNGWLFRYAYSATTDAFGIALQAGALFALLGAPRRDGAAATGARRLAAAGVLAGLAFLTRYNAVALLPAGLLAILGGATGAPRRGTAALVFAAAFFAAVAPWLAYSLAHGGTLATQLHHNIAYEVFARARGITWDEYQKDLQSQFPDLGSVFARDTGAVVSRMAFNAFDHLRQDALKLLGAPVALAALAGVALAWRAGWWRTLWPVAATGALLFATLVPVFYSERYSLALLPMYAAFAAAAFATPLLAFAAGRRPRVWLKALALPAVLALALPAAVVRESRALEQLPYEVLEAGHVLRGLRAPGDRVIARKAHVAFYGDCEPLPFPFADSLPQLADAARATGARWLYVSWPEAETRPKFYWMLDTAAVVPGLTVRYSSQSRPAVLYEVGPGFGRVAGWMRDSYTYNYHVARGRVRVETANAKLFMQYGALAWTLGRPQEAGRALDRALALDGSSHLAWSYMARTQSALGDHRAAQTAFRRAAEIEPRDADARAGYGLESLMLGQQREAAEAWRPVIRSTTDPRILEAMARLYDALGDAAAAGEARARLAVVRR